MKKPILIFFSILCFVFGEHKPSIHQQQLEYYNIHYTESNEQLKSIPLLPYYRNNNSTPSHEVFGYHPYWMGTAWTNYNFNLISTLAYFGAEVTAFCGKFVIFGAQNFWSLINTPLSLSVETGR